MNGPVINMSWVEFSLEWRGQAPLPPHCGLENGWMVTIMIFRFLFYTQYSGREQKTKPLIKRIPDCVPYTLRRGQQQANHKANVAQHGIFTYFTFIIGLDLKKKNLFKIDFFLNTISIDLIAASVPMAASRGRSQVNKRSRSRSLHATLCVRNCIFCLCDWFTVLKMIGFVEEK